MANPDWELETWKAQVSLTEKLLLLSAGALVIPSILESPVPQTAVFIGVVFVIGFGVAWFWLIIRGRRKMGGKSDG